MTWGNPLRPATWGTNNNSLHLYSAFLGTQIALHRRRISPHPPPMCSIHLDDATAAIVRQNALHTPAYWWRGDSDEANQCMRMIRRPWRSEASGLVWPGCQSYTPTLFRRTSWDFLMTTESQDLGLTSRPKHGAFSSIESPSLYWDVRTHTDHRVNPLLVSLTPLPAAT